MNRTMRCSRVLELIDDHVDGLLPAGDAEGVRDHLDDCQECRETALAARAASTSLATWGDHEPPAWCFDQILAKIDSLPPQALRRPPSRSGSSSPRRVLRWAAPTLAAAAAVVAAFVVQEGRRRPMAAPSRTVPTVVATPSAVSIDSRPSTLLPGEVYLHIDRSAWDPAIRRTPSGVVAPALPANFDESSFFVVPR
jgi:anti-sigma factor RsiW